MDFVDDKYIRFVGGRLDKFKSVKPGLYNFRCPYCGDSQKHKNKARGYFFLKGSEFIFKCHNCGVGRTVGNFLKDNAYDLHDEYVLEKYRNGATGKGRRTPKPKWQSSKPSFAQKVTDLTPISSLNKGHPARTFLEGRKIPQEKLSSLFYVEKFKSWVNTKKPNAFPNLQNDQPRIIIPLIGEDGIWFGIQGRSLAPNAKLRYITILFDEDKLKLYGLDTVNKEETIYVTEGPFDSHFIRNAIAMCGSDVDLSDMDHQFVFVFDNEPRNREIVARIETTIARGNKVVIFPKSIREKDLNDMVLAGHNVQDLVELNTYTGLQAKLKFNDWKKV
jgi:hypothetical protein|tara:strand:+ start:114 stop:1109 length:996 start_codon:yes stop_codon:yes gene_type:complete